MCVPTRRRMVQVVYDVVFATRRIVRLSSYCNCDIADRFKYGRGR